MPSESLKPSSTNSSWTFIIKSSSPLDITFGDKKGNILTIGTFTNKKIHIKIKRVKKKKI